MAYHFHESQLRVFRKYAKQDRNKQELEKTRVLIIEHILPTTEEMLYHLEEAGVTFGAILAKPYSIDTDVLKRLESKSYPIIRKSYEDLEKTTFLDELIQKNIEQAKNHKQKILVIAVGGYFAKPLTKLKKEDIQYFTGVVEDTTFGHNRYISLVSKIKIPVFSVARSVLKK